MNTDHEEFSTALCDTPPLPTDLFGQVSGRIRRKTLLTRCAVALLAGVCLSAGVVAIRNQAPSPAQVVSEEVSEELLVVYEFLHGYDLDQEVAYYTEAVYTP